MPMTTALVLPSTLGDGPDREVQILLADRWRKLVLKQLRRRALLADHSARVPITIRAVAGQGVLRLGPETQVLVPGVLVPVDAQILHNVQGDPAVAILVTFFRQADARDDDPTARLA
jgi:quercetin dioxygenase-like cupin family protein